MEAARGPAARARLFLSGVWKDFSDHNGPQAAAAFSFYCFLSIIPLMIFAGAVLGIVLKSDPELLQRIIDYIADNAPVLSDTISDALDSSIDLRGVLGVIGLLGLLFTGTKVIDSLQVWLSEMWGAEKPRFLRKKAKSLLSLLILGIIVLLGAGVHVVFTLVSERLRWLNVFAGMLVFAVTSLILFAALSFIYSYAVEDRLGFKRVWKGALFVALLTNPVQMLLIWYYSNMGDFSAIYGSLAGIVLTIVVIYYIGYMIFLGTGINHYLYRAEESEDGEEVLPAAFANGEGADGMPAGKG